MRGAGKLGICIQANDDGSERTPETNVAAKNRAATAVSNAGDVGRATERHRIASCNNAPPANMSRQTYLAIPARARAIIPAMTAMMAATR